MGFLIFAFRKLTLKREINQKEYALTILSQRQQRIQDQMSVMQQVKSNTQSAWQMISNSSANTAASVFQASIQGSQQKAADATKAWTDAQANGASADQVSQLKAKADAANAELTSQNNKAFITYQASQSAMVAANGVVNSVFSATDESDLAYLHTQDQQYEQQKASLESQLKVERAELESVEKAEDNAAKDVAPKFGLS